MSWSCLQCDEVADDIYDACWACGASRSGNTIRVFQHADHYEPTISPERTQYLLGDLMRVVTAMCLIFAFIGSPNVVTMILGIGAIGWLLLHLLSWISTKQVYHWQRQFRASRNRQLRSPDEDVSNGV